MQIGLKSKVIREKETQIGSQSIKKYEIGKEGESRFTKLSNIIKFEIEFYKFLVTVLL